MQDVVYAKSSTRILESFLITTYVETLNLHPKLLNLKPYCLRL